MCISKRIYTFTPKNSVFQIMREVRRVESRMFHCFSTLSVRLLTSVWYLLIRFSSSPLCFSIIIACYSRSRLRHCKVLSLSRRRAEIRPRSRIELFFSFPTKLSENQPEMDVNPTNCILRPAYSASLSPGLYWHADIGTYSAVAR